MTDRKIYQQDFEKTEILLLLICFYVKVLIFLKSVYVIVEFDEGHSEDEEGYVKWHVILETYIQEKPDNTDEVYQKTILEIMLADLL